MAAKCKKCDPHEICEECPEWIFTLADLIMCMMGLFVILWVLKPGGAPTAGSPEEKQLNEVVGAIRQGFGYVPDPDSTDPVDILLLDQMQRKIKQNGADNQGRTKQKAEGAEGTDPEVTAIRQGRVATVGGKINFDSGDARLNRATTAVLDQILKEIQGHRNIVLIKGHTSLDDLGENATAEQKMDLSLRRAQNVADYLTSKGVAPDTVRVQGCSTFEPVKQRAYTREQQSINRRVEIEFTDRLVEELQDQDKQSARAVTTPETASAKD